MVEDRVTIARLRDSQGSCDFPKSSLITSQMLGDPLVARPLARQLDDMIQKTTKHLTEGLTLQGGFRAEDALLEAFPDRRHLQ